MQFAFGKTSVWDRYKALFMSEYLYLKVLEPGDDDHKGALPGELFYNLDPTNPFDSIILEAEDRWKNRSLPCSGPWCVDFLLNFADAAFNNTFLLPDGGALYGINLHRRRAGVHRLGEDGKLPIEKICSHPHP